MKISLTDNKFQLSFSYDPALVAAVKSLPVRKYNPDTKSWLVPVAEAAALNELISSLPEVTFQGGAEQELTQRAGLAQASITASAAAQADIDIPAPEGMEYLPYQSAGIAYALRCFGDL